LLVYLEKRLFDLDVPGQSLHRDGVALGGNLLDITGRLNEAA
jgi:hypothetical protein